MQSPSSKSHENNSIDAMRLVENIFKQAKHDKYYFSSAVPRCYKIKHLHADSHTHRIPQKCAGTTLEGSSEDTSEMDCRKSYDSVNVAKRKKSIAASHTSAECDKEHNSARVKQILGHVKEDGARVHQTCSRPNGLNQEYRPSHPQLVPVQSNNGDIPQVLRTHQARYRKSWPDIDSCVAHGSHSATVTTSTRTISETPNLHQQGPLVGQPVSKDVNVAGMHIATASGNATAAAILLRELKRLRQSVESLEQNFKLMRASPQNTLVNMGAPDNPVAGLQAGSCAKDSSMYQSFNGCRNFWISAEACLRQNDLRMAVKIVLRSRHTRTLLKFLSRDELLGKNSPPILAQLEPSLLESLFEAIILLVQQGRYTRFILPWIFSAIRDRVISRLSGQMRAKIADGLREIAKRETDNVAASLVPHILGNC